MVKSKRTCRRLTARNDKGERERGRERERERHMLREGRGGERGGRRD